MIHWEQASTKRGLIWVVAGLLGVAGLALGKDVSQIVPFAMALAGAAGIATNDSKDK